MVTIHKQNDNLVFEADGIDTHDLHFWEKFLAKLWSFAYGTFLQDGRRIFWDVRHTVNAIRIDLDHEHFDQLIVEVENPEEAIRLLTS